MLRFRSAAFAALLLAAAVHAAPAANTKKKAPAPAKPHARQDANVTPKSTRAAKTSAGTSKVAATSAKKTSARKTTVAATRPTSKATSTAIKTPAARKSTVRATPNTTITKATARRYRVRRYYNPWTTPTYADSAWGDLIDGEDLVVRSAAVQALGPYNGAVVVADANTGRILTMVNQRTAVSSAYQPCSTIKLHVTLAALNEGLIDKETVLRLSRRESMNLTVALARSNNTYFEKLGNWLGYEKVYYYGKMFGLGERAGLNIAGENPGIFPIERPRGLTPGIMTSYGEGIGMTALQLTALVSAIANGGTLYYLQYPTSQEDARSFIPQVKRNLDIASGIAEIRPGMLGTVDFGSGRRAAITSSEPLAGKTGTCSDGPTHLGWFGSFNEFGRHRLTVVVMMTGGAPVKGPVAAGIAGQIFQTLSNLNYFNEDHTPPAVAASTLSSPIGN